MPVTPSPSLPLSLPLLNTLQVNAKLSDYGIACTATETGLTQAIGTRTCKAPELLKAPSSYTTYNEKVQCMYVCMYVRTYIHVRMYALLVIRLMCILMVY